MEHYISLSRAAPLPPNQAVVEHYKLIRYSISLTTLFRPYRHLAENTPFLSSNFGLYDMKFSISALKRGHFY